MLAITSVNADAQCGKALRSNNKLWSNIGKFKIIINFQFAKYASVYMSSSA